MKIKTSELSGVSLDWAVAMSGSVTEEKNGLFFECGRPFVGGSLKIQYQPSRSWAQGGPLIEAHGFCFDNAGKDGFAVVKDWYCGEPIEFYPPGITHLISACRAIVSAKLGDEVDVPEELL